MRRLWRDSLRQVIDPVCYMFRGKSVTSAAGLSFVFPESPSSLLKPHHFCATMARFETSHVYVTLHSLGPSLEYYNGATAMLFQMMPNTNPSRCRVEVPNKEFRPVWLEVNVDKTHEISFVFAHDLQIKFPFLRRRLGHLCMK